MKGDSNGMFRPSDPITRAEVSMIFARLGTGQSEFAGSYSSSFEDVKAASWYYNCVGYAQGAGIVNGYADNTFKPEKQITRAEFAAMVARFAKLEGRDTSDFTDLSGHWAEGEVAALAEKGWVGGYADGTFQPNQPITRAEVTKIVNRMLDRTPDKGCTGCIERRSDHIFRCFQDTLGVFTRFWKRPTAENRTCVNEGRRTYEALLFPGSGADSADAAGVCCLGHGNLIRWIWRLSASKRMWI